MNGLFFFSGHRRHKKACDHVTYGLLEKKGRQKEKGCHDLESLHCYENGHTREIYTRLQHGIDIFAYEPTKSLLQGDSMALGSSRARMDVLLDCFAEVCNEDELAFRDQELRIPVLAFADSHPRTMCGSSQKQRQNLKTCSER